MGGSDIALAPLHLCQRAEYIGLVWWWFSDARPISNARLAAKEKFFTWPVMSLVALQITQVVIWLAATFLPDIVKTTLQSRKVQVSWSFTL